VTRESIVEVIQSKIHQKNDTPIFAELLDIDFDSALIIRNFVQRRQLKKIFQREMGGLTLWPGFL
jgi:hypothetical protein